MNLNQLLEKLKNDPAFMEQVTCWQVIPPAEARYAPSGRPSALTGIRVGLGVGEAEGSGVAPVSKRAGRVGRGRSAVPRVSRDMPG